MKTLFIIPLIVLLTGCPGKGKEGAQYGERRAIYIEGDRICFTLDKKDVLESYSLVTSRNVSYELINNYSSKLRYPDTCFTVNLEKAVVYGVDYIINQKIYYYSFIIDNDGQILDLGGSAVCPYPSKVSEISCMNRENQNLHFGKMRGVFIDGNRVCFSVNKKQVLGNYEFSSVGKVKKILLSGRSTQLSYPESCFMVALEYGVIYRLNYTLDNNNYYDVFIIDSSGSIKYLWWDSGCQYMSIIPWK